MFCIVQRVIIVETNIENILLLRFCGGLNFPIKGFFVLVGILLSGTSGSFGMVVSLFVNGWFVMCRAPLSRGD